MPVTPGWRTNRLPRANPVNSLHPAVALSSRRPGSAGLPQRSRGSRTAFLPAGVFPPAALYYAIGLIGIVAIRAHELLPVVGVLRPALALSLLALALILFRVSPLAREAAFGDIAVKLIVGYFAWALVTAPFSVWPTASLTMAVTTGLPAVVMVATILLSPPTQRSVDRLSIGFVAFAAIHILGLRFLGIEWAGRLTGDGAFDSNDLASLAAMTFPIAAGLVLRQKGWVRTLGLAAAAIMLASMVSFNSRGGTLAMIAGILTLVVLQRGQRRWALLALAVAGCAVTWITASQDYRDRIIGISDLQNDYNVTAYEGREQVWARARGYIARYPVTGVGINAFPVMEGLTLKEAGLHGKWSNTHNAYLQAFSELGLPGGTVFILILLTAAKRAKRLAKPLANGDATPVAHPEYLASLLAFATGAYFLSHAYFYAMFALTGMIAFAAQVTARQLAVARPTPGIPAHPAARNQVQIRRQRIR